MAGVVTYINIGNTCEVYQTPLLPGPTSTFYANTYLSNANVFLKNDLTQTTEGTQLSVDYTQYAFKAFTTQNLLLGASNQLRHLQNSNDSAVNTNRPLITGPNWDTPSGTFTYPDSGPNATVYSIFTTPARLRNLFVSGIRAIQSFQSRAADGSIAANYTATPINYVSGSGLTPTAGGDAGSTAVATTNPPRFYLRTLPPSGGTNFANVEVFYRSWGGVTPGETNLGSIDVVSSNLSSNIGHQFTFKIDESVTPATLSVYTGDGNTKISDLSCNYDDASRTITVTSANRSNTYIPDISVLSDQIAASQYVLFRNVGNSQYVYWSVASAATGGTTLGLRSYWTNAVSAAELSRRTIFMWDDLTPGSTTSVALNSGSNVDLYRWKFQSPTPGSALSTTTFSHLFYTKNAGDDGGSLTLSTVIPANTNEGWALIYNTGTDTDGGFIGYVRNNKVIAVMDNAGLLPPTATAAGINLGATPYTTAPAANAPGYKYRCIRCTSLGANGLCAA